MWPFDSHKCTALDVERTLIQRITKLEDRILRLELESDTFRDKVLRKIQKKRDSDIPEELNTSKPGLMYHRNGNQS